MKEKAGRGKGGGGKRKEGGAIGHGASYSECMYYIREEYNCRQSAIFHRKLDNGRAFINTNGHYGQPRSSCRKEMS